MDVQKTTQAGTVARAPADTSESAASTKKGADTTLGYDAFLQLLVAQMQNQDPLEPMKSTDYVAQLATFSQVEKTVEMNDRIAAMLTSSRMEQAEGLIGKTVTSADGAISGIVQSAKVVGNNVMALLADGRELAVGTGVTISGGRT
ncbi:MAG: flagellar hook assembly protein FlgD [Hyphomicrobiaceae bacterium]